HWNKRDNVTYLLDLDLSRVPELKEDQEKNANIAAKSWWMNIGEKRELMQLDQLDDDILNETVLIPSNLIPVSEASIMFEPTQERLQEDEDKIEDADEVEDEKKYQLNGTSRHTQRNPAVRK
ncbi:MAG: hypothetical protein ACC656_10330, partial [Candidatus Heimdallarchaeota archaeon]